MLEINLNFFIGDSILFIMLKTKFQNSILVTQAPLQVGKILYQLTLWIWKTLNILLNNI